MHRLWRLSAALLAFFALATPVPPAPFPPRPGAGAIAMSIEPVPLNPSDPAQDRVGALRYLGGWALSSHDRRLGGISGLHVERGEAIAISDAGDVLRFPLPTAAAGHAEVMPLLQGPGSPERKLDRDTESLAVSGGTAWITFENHNAIWRYRLPGWRAVSHAKPAAMAEWPAVRGAEAMARLPGGRFLVMSESLDPDGTSPALLFAGDPADPATPAHPLRFRPPPGYRITDAAALPDGRVLLVTRRVRWNLIFPVKLLVGRLPERAGGTMDMREIADLAPPLTSDNYEAVSIVQENGRTIVWLASDDNTTPLQRTLLLKFEWLGEGRAA